MLRALPFEIAFNCKEDAFRKFLSSLDDSDKYYYVIRSMRVSNEKQKAPTAADAEFKTEEAPIPAGGGEATPFGGGGGFVLPGDDTPVAPTPAPGTPAAPAAPAPAGGAAAAAGSDLILKQVLGSEKINVFLRIDIIQFFENKAGTPAKNSPRSNPGNN
jgi:hypothetical protein